MDVFDPRTELRRPSLIRSQALNESSSLVVMVVVVVVVVIVVIASLN